MQSENDLIQKLMVSKKIMDIHKQMPRGGVGGTTPMVEEYNAPQASYNIPQEYLQEQPTQVQQKLSSQLPNQDRILSSKLPDEIKRLMIEHPIQQPANMGGPTLSNDLVEKASRLMNTNAKGEVSKQTQRTTQQSSTGINPNELKSMIRETIQEVLSENGLLVESVSKSNDVFSFKVGKHVFEGKVTKIKKVQ